MYVCVLFGETSYLPLRKSRNVLLEKRQELFGAPRQMHVARLRCVAVEAVAVHKLLLHALLLGVGHEVPEAEVVHHDHAVDQRL